jgi:hypothetical protein
MQARERESLFWKAIGKRVPKHGQPSRKMAVIELHGRAVRCISSIPWLRKCVKFHWIKVGTFLPKGATRLASYKITIGLCRLLT